MLWLLEWYTALLALSHSHSMSFDVRWGQASKTQLFQGLCVLASVQAPATEAVGTLEAEGTILTCS